MKKIYLFFVAAFATLAASAAVSEPAWYNDVTSITNNGQYYIYSVKGAGFVQAGKDKVKSVTSNNYTATTDLLFTITGTNAAKTYCNSSYLSSYQYGTCGPVGESGTSGSNICWTAMDNNSYWNIHGKYNFLGDKYAALKYDDGYSATANILGQKETQTGTEYRWYLISRAHYDRHWAIYLFEVFKDGKDITPYKDNVPTAYYNAMDALMKTTYDVKDATKTAEEIRNSQITLKGLLDNAEDVKTAYANAKAVINALEGLKDKGEGDLTQITNDIATARTAIDEAMSVAALETATSAPKLKAIDPITFTVFEFTALQPLGEPAASANGRALTYEAADKKIINAENLPVYKGTTTLTATAAATDAYYEFVRSAEVKVNAIDNTGEASGSVCEGTTFSYEGKEYAAGTHTVTLVNRTGGDSVVTLVVEARPVYNTTDGATICQNELPYTWEGENFTEAGVITKTLTSSVGCDSTVTFTLNVLPTYNVNDEATICASELPYSWEGETFTEAGVITKTLTSSVGCDSTVTFTLNVLPTYNVTDEATICASELPYTWETETFTEAGYKTLTLKTINNCDSVVTFTLNVLPVSPDTEREETITAGEWVEMHGDQIVLDVVGDTLLVDSLLNINGCDSVILFTVHVLEPVVSNINNARSNSDQVQKFFRNGRMYILRGKELYDIIGRKQE